MPDENLNFDERIDVYQAALAERDATYEAVQEAFDTKVKDIKERQKALQVEHRAAEDVYYALRSDADRTFRKATRPDED